MRFPYFGNAPRLQFYDPRVLSVVLRPDTSPPPLSEP